MRRVEGQGRPYANASQVVSFGRKGGGEGLFILAGLRLPSIFRPWGLLLFLFPPCSSNSFFLLKWPPVVSKIGQIKTFSSWVFPNHFKWISPRIKSSFDSASFQTTAPVVNRQPKIEEEDEYGYEMEATQKNDGIHLASKEIQRTEDNEVIGPTNKTITALQAAW